MIGIIEGKSPGKQEILKEMKDLNITCDIILL